MIPAWLLTFLLQRVAPLIIEWLRKEGYIDAAEALVAKGAVWTVDEVKSLKAYREYPNDPKPPSNVSNINQGQ